MLTTVDKSSQHFQMKMKDYVKTTVVKYVMIKRRKIVPNLWAVAMENLSHSTNCLICLQQFSQMQKYEKRQLVETFKWAHY